MIPKDKPSDRRLYKSVTHDITPSMRKDRDKPWELIQIDARAITGAHFERRLLSRDPLRGIKGGGKGRSGGAEFGFVLSRSGVEADKR